MNIEDYILYLFLKKLYCYYDANLDKSIFNEIPYDYMFEYLKSVNYILDSTNDMNLVIDFINNYYKNSKDYPKEYKITKLQSKIIKLILKEDKNIQKYNENIEKETSKTTFIYNKAKEYINNISKTKKK